MSSFKSLRVSPSQVTRLYCMSSLSALRLLTAFEYFPLKAVCRIRCQVFSVHRPLIKYSSCVLMDGLPVAVTRCWWILPGLNMRIECFCFQVSSHVSTQKTLKSGPDFYQSSLTWVTINRLVKMTQKVWGRCSAWLNCVSFCFSLLPWDYRSAENHFVPICCCQRSNCYKYDTTVCSVAGTQKLKLLNVVPHRQRSALAGGREVYCIAL